MFLTEQFIEKLFYFLEPELGTLGEHGNLRNSHKLVPIRTKVWEHQGVRLGLLVNLRDRSITTRLATAVHGRGRGGRNRLHIAPVQVSRRLGAHPERRVPAATLGPWLTLLARPGISARVVKLYYQRDSTRHRRRM